MLVVSSGFSRRQELDDELHLLVRHRERPGRIDIAAHARQDSRRESMLTAEGIHMPERQLRPVPPS